MEILWNYEHLTFCQCAMSVPAGKPWFLKLIPNSHVSDPLDFAPLRILAHCSAELFTARRANTSSHAQGNESPFQKSYVLYLEKRAILVVSHLQNPSNLAFLHICIISWCCIGYCKSPLREGKRIRYLAQGMFPEIRCNRNQKTLRGKAKHKASFVVCLCIFHASKAPPVESLTPNPS